MRPSSSSRPGLMQHHLGLRWQPPRMQSTLPSVGHQGLRRIRRVCSGTRRKWRQALISLSRKAKAGGPRESSFPRGGRQGIHRGGSGGFGADMDCDKVAPALIKWPRTSVKFRGLVYRLVRHQVIPNGYGTTLGSSRQVHSSQYILVSAQKVATPGTYSIRYPVASLLRSSSFTGLRTVPLMCVYQRPHHLVS